MNKEKAQTLGEKIMNEKKSIKNRGGLLYFRICLRKHQDIVTSVTWHYLITLISFLPMSASENQWHQKIPRHQGYYVIVFTRA